MTQPVDRASQPVVNLALNPRCVGTASTSSVGSTPGTVTASTTRWFSGEDASSVKVVGGTGRAWFLDMPTLLAGVYRWSFWIYAEAACTLNPYWEMSGPYAGGAGGGAVSVPAWVWTRVTGTATITAEQVAAGVGSRNFKCGYHGSSSTAATTVYADDAVITYEQPLPEVSVRGTTPGWQWRSSPDASASVGYPYTLESIAGPPLASIYRSAVAQSVPLDLPGGTLLSLYAAGARRGQTYLQPVRAQSDASRIAISLQESASTVGQAVAGFGQVEAAAAAFARASTMVTDAPLVLGAVRLSPTSGRLLYSNPSSYTSHWSTVSLSGDFAERITSLRHPNAVTADQWDAVHLYAASHDDATSRRVMAWLARRYGPPIPAGY